MLGDGTDYSRERAVAALAAVAPLVPELFEPTAVERRLAAAEVAVDPAQLQGEFAAVLAHVLGEATLDWPTAPGLAGSARQAGRDGVHTQAMGHLLAELQSVARATPGATW
jgi:ring-1,2-phenylacetyl-CoA epoxidase subunit PaaC